MPDAPNHTLMYAEAAAAATVAARQLASNDPLLQALGARLRAKPPRFVVTCARGSSDHAATFAKYLVETQLGLVTASASPSVASVYAAPLDLRDALFIGLSQSGQSPDLVDNAARAKQAGALVVAMVNVVDSPLARTADVIVPLLAGAERSVAATKSFLGTLFAIAQWVAHWHNDARLLAALQEMPHAMHEAFALDWSSLVDGLQQTSNLFVLGRGLGYGAAQEGALKFKETCGVHAEAFSTAEVQHGPMALVGSGFPVLLFGQDDGTLAGALETAQRFRQRGARVWTAAPGDTHADALPIIAPPHPALAPILAIQSLYPAINALALARGLDPDQPPHLHKVTETV